MSLVSRLVLAVLTVAVAVWAVGEGGAVGAVAALAIGGLAMLRLRDEARIAALERRAEALERRLADRAAPEAPAAEAPAPEAAPQTTPQATPHVAAAASSARPPRWEGLRAPASRSRLASLPEPVRHAWQFATGGNPVARVGLLVLFVGIGLAIRYAVDVGWLSVEIRLGLAALAGAALVAVGWRLRQGTPGFGLTLQGGGVAVLYLTTYAAFALYGVVPSLAAIALMAVVSVLCGALAVVQGAPGLAVLGVTGGFAAPVLAGTAEGNHVLLLSYYALLNLGVLGVAWAKGWRSVAVVGFVSTFVTGSLWGGLAYTPALYGSVQPFLVLSFAVYLALAVRFALRSARRAAVDAEGRLTTDPPERALVVDGGLVFGLPAATFVAQAAIVEGVVPYGRAWSAAALAAVYLGGWAWLRRREARLLTDAFLAIGLAFATLALPLAFERVVFGAMWVLEGAALVWVGMRQGKDWMRWGGVALQAVAASVVFGEGVLTPSSTFAPQSLTGWIVAVGLALSAYVLRRRDRPARPAADPPALDLRQRTEAEVLASRLLLAFALLWWTVTATVHVLDLAAERHVFAGLLGAAAASGGLFLALGRVLDWRALRAAALGVVPVAGLLWVAVQLWGVDPFGAWRGAGWVACAAVAALALAAERRHRLRRVAFVGAVWLATAVLASGLAWRVDAAAPGDWALGLVGAILAAALAATLRLPDAVADGRQRGAAALGLALAAATWSVVAWSRPGLAPPLPTLPLVNPLGLPAVAALLGVAALGRQSSAPARGLLAALVGALGFGGLTAEVLRGAHAFGAAPWSAEALWHDSAAQAALAVAWTMLALALAVWAVRAGSRPLWFFGAAVLALVVAKLMLVDLGQAEALVRIAAFLIVGLLVLLIGYRAPLPPEDGRRGSGPGGA